MGNFDISLKPVRQMKAFIKVLYDRNPNITSDYKMEEHRERIVKFVYFYNKLNGIKFKISRNYPLL
jgi:hypothetical protein